ncbi:ABC transporter substrate-binding protein [Methylotetracoccus oryzae]|uniref:ABC transporter substrate-binding protein n=1 Tax=Methylotetracoccus oryzae TaxID=1919059 RepID=UPI00191438DC|nr:ABC transporter substrate-binding protein [Methylotetracoccus oryzae]
MHMRYSAGFLLALVLNLTGCSAGGDAPAADGRTPVALQLNWVPEPEFGGYYAALQIGADREAGLSLDVRGGGPGTPVEQMVAAGRIDFGVSSADNVLIARSRGADLVAIYAVYQTFPQGIMTHSGRGLKSLAQVFESGTIAMEPGTPYERLLRQRFGLDKVRAVPYTNNLAPFLHDPLFAQQCFITAEPIAARRAGADPQVFPLTDVGYNPYAGVIITRSKVIAENPELVRSLVATVRRGWQAYLQDPRAANAEMHRLNPTMDLETFAAVAAAQEPLIAPADPSESELGTMRLERWEALAAQLTELGIIDRAEPSNAFHNP